MTTPRSGSGAASRDLLSGRMYPHGYNGRLAALEAAALRYPAPDDLLLPAESWGEEPPGVGLHAPGERVWNTAPAPGGWIGWVCVAEGEPGTWKGFGAIES